jgi:hypothetical protein
MGSFADIFNGFYAVADFGVYVAFKPFAKIRGMRDDPSIVDNDFFSLNLFYAMQYDRLPRDVVVGKEGTHRLHKPFPE